MLLLLALAAVACPGHRFQSGFRDRLLAHFAHTECSPPDSSQCFFDRAQEMSIGLVHTDLKLRFRVRVRLVNKIALPAAGRRYRRGRFGGGSRQFLPLGY